MYIDTHAHLNDEKLINNVENVIKNAYSNNVGIILCVGYDMTSNISAIKISEKYDNVFAIIGFHPENASDFNYQCEQFLLENGNNKKVVAIGEIGLDYHYTKKQKEVQKNVFEKQIEIANILEKPIVIHTRDAIKDTMEIIVKNKSKIQKAVFHCFSESLEIANDISRLGYCISVGGALTFQNAKNIVNVIEHISLDNVMLETDCPYLAPVPHRGDINEPKYIPLIANKIAQLKNINESEVEKITTKNAKIFFGV